METIAEMIPINISGTPSIIDNVFVRAYSSPEEIQASTQRVYHELTLMFFKLTYEI
jgi:hypothetical protein